MFEPQGFVGLQDLSRAAMDCACACGCTGGAGSGSGSGSGGDEVIGPVG